MSPPVGAVANGPHPRLADEGEASAAVQVHRRIGGQGIVQFSRGRYDDDEFAIKFFLNRVAFEREEALYTREDLRRMMPAVKDIVPNTDGAICNAAGYVFPPCIVVEKGESLDEWAMRIEPDFPTILTVLCHILARLQQLHTTGIAHRDLKPGNVLWRPKHHAWTLIDFGCAAEIGAPLRPAHAPRSCPSQFQVGSQRCHTPAASRVALRRITRACLAGMYRLALPRPARRLQRAACRHHLSVIVQPAVLPARVHLCRREWPEDDGGRPGGGHVGARGDLVRAAHGAPRLPALPHGGGGPRPDHRPRAAALGDLGIQAAEHSGAAHAAPHRDELPLP